MENSIYLGIDDPLRRRMLALLANEGELCVCELVAATGEAQGKISRHLGILRAAEVVSLRKEGTWVIYRIRADLPAWVQRLLRVVVDRDKEAKGFAETLKNLRAMPNRPGLLRCCA